MTPDELTCLIQSANQFKEFKACEGRSKGSKPHPQRRAIPEHFCCDNIFQDFKLEKTNSDFCLHFWSGESLIKGEWQI